jgi:hypothetical protein
MSTYLTRKVLYFWRRPGRPARLACWERCLHLMGLHLTRFSLYGHGPHGRGTHRCVSHGCVPRGVYLISVYLISVHLLGVHLMGVVYLEAFRCFNLAFWEKVPTPHHRWQPWRVFALPTVRCKRALARKQRKVNTANHSTALGH